MAVLDELQGPAMGLHDELQRGALWPGHGRTELCGETSRARRRVARSSARRRSRQRGPPAWGRAGRRAAGRSGAAGRSFSG